ncbi:hypothetical protein HDU82_003597 [Entophlyctis luteolus]|nr:hypothetical protein HDU82_003597 [Entophlyctis luteolus]
MGLVHVQYLDDSDDWGVNTASSLSGSPALSYSHSASVRSLAASSGGSSSSSLSPPVCLVVCAKCNTHLSTSVDIISKDRAFEESQRYKEGRFILEVAAFKDVEPN